MGTGRVTDTSSVVCSPPRANRLAEPWSLRTYTPQSQSLVIGDNCRRLRTFLTCFVIAQAPGLPFRLSGPWRPSNPWFTLASLQLLINPAVPPAPDLPYRPCGPLTYLAVPLAPDAVFRCPQARWSTSWPWRSIAPARRSSPASSSRSSRERPRSSRPADLRQPRPRRRPVPAVPSLDRTWMNIWRGWKRWMSVTTCKLGNWRRIYEDGRDALLCLGLSFFSRWTSADWSRRDVITGTLFSLGMSEFRKAVLCISSIHGPGLHRRGQRPFMGHSNAQRKKFFPDFFEIVNTC